MHVQHVQTINVFSSKIHAPMSFEIVVNGIKQKYGWEIYYDLYF